MRKSAPVAERASWIDERATAVLDALPETVILLDASGTIVAAWGACAEIFGEQPADLLGIEAYTRVHPDDIGYASGALAEAISRAEDHIPINLRIRAADGTWVYAEAAAGYIDVPDMLLITLRPLRYRGHMDERRAELQRRCLRIASAVAAAHGTRLQQALVDGVTSINEFFRSTSARFLVGADIRVELGGPVEWPEPVPHMPGTFHQHARRGEHTVIEVPVPAEHEARWLLAWGEPDPGGSGWDGSHLDDLQMAGAIIAAATARLDLEADLLYRSRHDSLTGLPNRAELERLLQRQLDRSAATVLFCDLDGYKLVNDEFGHRIGDRVLAAVATRLAESMRASDVLARVGGDEFVAVCPPLAPDEIARTVARLEQALGDPIVVDGVMVFVGVSVGAATAPQGATAASVIAAADVEMYAAKAARKSD